MRILLILFYILVWGGPDAIIPLPVEKPVSGDEEEDSKTHDEPVIERRELERPEQHADKDTDAHIQDGPRHLPCDWRDYRRGEGLECKAPSALAVGKRVRPIAGHGGL